MRLAGACRPHLETCRQIIGVGRARHAIEHDRQRIGHGRAGEAPLGERARAAQHEQAAAPHLDELRDHPQLIARERRRLDVAQDQAAILEQLLAGRREAPEQVVGIVDPDAQELVLGGPLQGDHLEVVVVSDRLPQELHFEPRLPFVMKDALAPVHHLDHRLARVVLRDDLAVARGDLEGEHARARVVGHDTDANRSRFAVGRELEGLRAHQAPAVLNVKHHGLAGIPRLAHDGVDQQ